MKKRIIEAASVVKATAAALAAVASIGAAQAADIANGRAIVERTNCAACHGPGLNKPVSPDYPKLAGQHADYIYWSLRQYQMGGGNPTFGRNNAIMAAQVQSLSESDLKDIAAYVQSLKGDLLVKK